MGLRKAARAERPVTARIRGRVAKKPAAEMTELVRPSVHYRQHVTRGRKAANKQLTLF
jgi:hypothetical protein